MQLENFDFGLYTGEVLACPTTITPTVFFHPYRSHEFPVVFFREVRRTQRGRRGEEKVRMKLVTFAPLSKDRPRFLSRSLFRLSAVRP